MAVLQEMLPQDMVDYCQKHGMLSSILEGPGEAKVTPATAQTNDFQAF